MLLATGWWPPNVDFDGDDLATLQAVEADRVREMERRGRK